MTIRTHHIQQNVKSSTTKFTVKGCLLFSSFLCLFLTVSLLLLTLNKFYPLNQTQNSTDYSKQNFNFSFIFFFTNENETIATKTPVKIGEIIQINTNNSGQVFTSKSTNKTEDTTLQSTTSSNTDESNEMKEKDLYFIKPIGNNKNNQTDSKGNSSTTNPIRTLIYYSNTTGFKLVPDHHV